MLEAEGADLYVFRAVGAGDDFEAGALEVLDTVGLFVYQVELGEGLADGVTQRGHFAVGAPEGEEGFGEVVPGLGT